MAFRFFKSLFPIVKAQEEEELVDPQQELREKCSQEPHASKLYEKFQTCQDRVNSRTKTAETCQEELFDYLHALDHCVTKTLFTRLK
ncbi:CLUMA_CG019134, isoform A [Clunio marinus]|uniref:Cytochrome b-c1 complex subunit 6 n=1 Tax=Clunio marinus TaxID=568069 RepID=A0A1J1J0J6_9DIPT|nr:CLUMA_CG019134, isoform A [Clunio marinus]